MGKRIISFSLWGGIPIYNRGAIANIEEAKLIYPGWKCRFYVHNQSPVLSELQKMDCEIVVKEIEPGWSPSYWRFLAASDPDVGYVIFRDCDSRVNSREAVAVEEWISSGKNVHLMKDSPAHTLEIILAGMWGIKGGIIKNMGDLIKEWTAKDDVNYKYSDQKFLRYKLWPIIKDSVVIHGLDSPSGKAIPFPTHSPMRFGYYVGQVISLGLG